MKTFDVLTTIAGSKLVVYPGGHLARNPNNYHYDPAYIDVREVSAAHDRIEVVCGGHVTQHVTVLRKQAPETIIEMMKELS